MRKICKAILGRTQRKFAYLATLSLSVTASTAQAQTPYYWDTNGTTTGAGGTPSGTWNTTNAFFNSDPTGGSAGSLTAATLNTYDLYFVAGPSATSGNGAYTITVSGAQVANSLNFQSSGAAALSGGSITLGNGTAGSGGINVAQYAYGTTNNGAVSISSAIILNNSQNWTNNSTGILTISGGVTGAFNLTLNNNGATTAGITLSGSPVNNAGTITNAGTGIGSTAISAVIGANVTGLIQNSATSTLTLSGANTYSGQTQILNGILSINIQDNGAAGTGGPLGVVPASVNATSILINGGTLQDTVNALTLNANRGIVLGSSSTNKIVATNGNFAYAGVIADQSTPAMLTIGLGAGNWVPGGQYTYSGGTILASGSNTIPTVNSTGSAGAPTSGPLGTGTLDFAGGAFRATTGASAGITIANAVTFTANSNTIPNSTTFLSGGTNIDRSLTFSGPVTLGVSPTLIVNTSPASSSVTISFNGIISDGGNGYGLTISGTGTGSLTLAGANTFTGSLTINTGTVTISAANAYNGSTINGGTLIVSADSNLGTAPTTASTNITISGGTLQENTGFSTNGNRQIAIGSAGATFDENAAGNFTVAGLIKDVAAGAGALNITGVGAGIYVPQALNTYSGGTHLGAGTTTVPNSNSTGSASTSNLTSGPFGVGTLYFDGGKFRAQSGTTNDLVGNAVQITADTTFIAGSGSDTVTFNGPVTLVNGTRTITQLATANVIFSGIIGDGGLGYGLTLSSTSTGPLVLSGANTYSGATTVNGGTLLISGQTAGTSGTGTGAVTVAAAGTLGGGNGRVAGLVTNNGIVTAGTSTALKTLYLNGGITFASTSTYQVNVFDTTAAGTSLLNVTGAATLGSATVELNFSGTTEETLRAAVGNGNSRSYTILTTDTVPDLIGSFASTVSATSLNSTGFVSSEWSLSYSGNNVILTFSPVPEPATGLMIGGFFGLAAFGLRQRRRWVRTASG